MEQELIFGGDTLTTTDIVVALGKFEIGDPTKVMHLDKKLLEKIYSKMVEEVEIAIDKMKTSVKPVPIILVGGGSILLPNNLKGASEVIRPENFGVANAIGVAIAQVSGQIERVFSLDELGREKTLEIAKSIAIQEAIKAGADSNGIKIVDIEDVPLPYLPGNATRIRVKAQGTLAGIIEEQTV